MGTKYDWQARCSPRELGVKWEVLDEIEAYFKKKFSRRAVGFLWGSVAYIDDGDILDSSREKKTIMEKAEVIEFIKGDREKFLEEIETRIAIFRVSQ